MSNSEVPPELAGSLSMPIGPLAAAEQEFVSVETKEQVPRLSVAQLLADDVVGDASEEMGFVALFEQWHLAYQDLNGKDACEKAVTRGLNCLKVHLGWSELMRLNLPVMIKLSASGHVGYLTIAGMDGDEALLQSGKKRYRAVARDIEQAWDGESMIIWKPPTLDIDVLRPGARGESVVWLRRNLDKALGEVVTTGPPNLYDPELSQRVKAFQRSRSLKADGLAGAMTLIHLYAVVGDTTVPVLSATRSQI